MINKVLGEKQKPADGTPSGGVLQLNWPTLPTANGGTMSVKSYPDISPKLSK